MPWPLASPTSVCIGRDSLSDLYTAIEPASAKYLIRKQLFYYSVLSICSNHCLLGLYLTVTTLLSWNLQGVQTWEGTLWVSWSGLCATVLCRLWRGLGKDVEARTASSNHQIYSDLNLWKKRIKKTTAYWCFKGYTWDRGGSMWSLK